MAACCSDIAGAEHMGFRRAERMAAMAVLAAAAAVAGAGVKLAKKHTVWLMQKAAATFKDDEDESLPDGNEETEENN